MISPDSYLFTHIIIILLQKFPKTILVRSKNCNIFLNDEFGTFKCNSWLMICKGT